MGYEWHLFPHDKGDVLCWVIGLAALFLSFYFRRQSPFDSKGWLGTAILFLVLAGLGHALQ